MRCARRVTVVLGTRPDAIKLAPVIRELRCRTDEFATQVVATGQHREMLDQVLSVFGITPDVDLEVMVQRQTLAESAARILPGLDETLARLAPDLVVVQGDTTTTFVASLAAFYRQIRVAHVEAGLRTGDKFAPFPEEINRRLTSVLADLHLAPTVAARRALEREGIEPGAIYVTGNTVIDALLTCVEPHYRFEDPTLNRVVEGRRRGGRRLLLVTAHRRENWGERLREVAVAIRELSARYPDVDVVLPLHLNPAVRDVIEPMLRPVTSVALIAPLEYRPFVNLMSVSDLVLTDSGGVQEEAPALGKPVLVMRDTTERPEAVAAGVARIVGTSSAQIVGEVSRLLDDRHAYADMARRISPYGDGKAASRIAEAVAFHFGLRDKRPTEFAS